MRLKKAMILFGTVCILNTITAGCTSGHEPVVKTEGTRAEEESPEELNDAPLKDIDGNTGAPQENTAGKWHVLEPDDAAAVDADFMGKVRKMEEDSFFIVERKVKILDDGSVIYSSPSSDADIPDSQLVHVVFEEDTRFYLKDTDGNKETGFQDLKEHMCVEMKGSFKNDEFHAIEIRFF